MSYQLDWSPTGFPLHLFRAICEFQEEFKQPSRQILVCSAIKRANMIEDNLAYEFDGFRLTPAERQLLRDGNPVALAPKAFDTLVVLVQNHGHALKKDDLMRQVWPDAFVEESNLNHYISVLRKSLNCGSSGDGYVQTVRGYGFRFNADVRAVSEESTPLLVHRKTRTHAWR